MWLYNCNGQTKYLYHKYKCKWLLRGYDENDSIFMSDLTPAVFALSHNHLTWFKYERGNTDIHVLVSKSQFYENPSLSNHLNLHS